MAISNPSQVAGQVLTDVVNRMADQTIGFNVQLPVTIAGNPRYTNNAAWLTNHPLVFPADYSGSSPNVVLAPININDWMKTSPTLTCASVLVQIYTINAIYAGNASYREKGRLFDGIVNIGIDCHVLWPNSQVVYDMDAPVSAIEDTVYAIFNTDSLPYTSWTSGTIWNGVLSVPARSAVTPGGPGFVQLTTFTLGYGLVK